MSHRFYKTTTSSHGSSFNDLYLVVQVYSTIYEEPKMMFEVVLAELMSGEEDLNAGRFVNYVHWHEDHAVSFHTPPYYLMAWFNEQLDWIASNVKSRWSFDLQMANVHNGKIDWSFQNPAEAMLFKLTF